MSDPVKCSHCMMLVEVSTGTSLQSALMDHYIDLHREAFIKGTLTVSVIRAA